MTVALKQNIAGYTDELGRFRPIRSPEYVGGRTATRKDKRKYSRAKAGDLGKAKQERALEAPWDTEARLRKEAAEKKARDEKRIMAEIEGDIYGGESDGKGYSLLQFVRNAGGFRRQLRHGGKKAFGKRAEWDKGEIDRLSYKETGKRGLTTDQPNKGKTPDKMYQAALAAGFDVASISDLMDKVESEAAGHGATYSTHGYMNYTERENPKDTRHGYEILHGKRRLSTFLSSDRKAALALAKKYGPDVTIRRVNLTKQWQQQMRGRINPATKTVDWGMRVCANCDKYFPNSKLSKLGEINVCSPCKKKLTARTAAKSQQSLFDDQGNLFNPATKINSSVAQTILQQLGGNKFIAMTGAKNLGHSGGNSLSFRLPANFAREGINYVKITLTSRDLYDVDFGKIRGVKYTKLHTDTGIYADMLPGLFERRTGLNTSLGTMGRTNPKKKNPVRVLLHKFYAGQKLSTRSIGDYDTIYRAEVISRTPKMVTFKLEGHREIKKAKVHRKDNTEYFYPHGRHSMASIFTAEKGQRANPAKNPATDLTPELRRRTVSALADTEKMYTKLTAAYKRRPQRLRTKADRDLIAFYKKHIAYLKGMLKSGKFTPKKNPDAVSIFAGLAGGLASALSIHDRLSRPTRRKATKKRGTTTAKTKTRHSNPAVSARIKASFANEPKSGNYTFLRIGGDVYRRTNSTGRISKIKEVDYRAKNPKPKTKNRNRNLYAMTIGSGDDIFAVVLKDKDGDGFSKEFRTMASAKAYATRNKHKVEWNPAAKKANPGTWRKLAPSAKPLSCSAPDCSKRARWCQHDTGFYYFCGEHAARVKKTGRVWKNPTAKRPNGMISRALARRKAASEYKRELRLEAAAERSRARRRKAEAKAKGNPLKHYSVEVRIEGVHYPEHRLVYAGNAAAAKRMAIAATKAHYIGRKVMAGEVYVQKKKNPPRPRPVKHTQARRTFEMFQGRPSEKVYTEVPVSSHAPARLDQLGDLIELKIAGGPTLKFNGKGVRLCAAGGKLWIAGKRFAKANPSAKLNEINPIGEIDHVVYGTSKPHHGDHAYTHYIHKLGEESGKRPILCVDKQGFPVIRGGNYKIEARGIVD